MLVDFYGFREQPFGVTPDPRYLYLSRTHREALASLFYGIESGQGFLALIAEPGTGKTTLLYRLLQRLQMSVRAVYLFQTQCTSREFFSFLSRELGIATWKGNLGLMREKLNEIVMSEASLGKHFLLIIDEAQNLGEDVLESVRLLSNFETTSAKLMQIVIAGQPQLADKLMRPSLVQLRQRISTVCRVCALNPSEVEEYIDHRLQTAGYSGDRLFTTEALAAIADESQGIPRLINNLCFNALSLAYAKEAKSIAEADVREVAADLDLRPLDLEDAPRRQTASLRANASATPILPDNKPPILPDDNPTPIPQVTDPFFERVLAVLHTPLPVPFSIREARFWPPFAASVTVILTLAWVVAASIDGGLGNAWSQVSSSFSQDGVASSMPIQDTITVVVKPNDTLSGLCIHYLGWYDEKLAQDIYILNPDIESPYKLRIGQQIRLPRAERPKRRNSLISDSHGKLVTQRERKGEH